MRWKHGTPVAFPKGHPWAKARKGFKEDIVMNNSLVYNPAKWLDQFFSDFDSNGSAKRGFAPAVDVVEDKE